MNCFSKVINLLGLNSDSQGSAGWVFIMLSLLSATDAGAGDTYSNPFKELLHRLSAHENTHAYRELAQMIGARVDTR